MPPRPAAVPSSLQLSLFDDAPPAPAADDDGGRQPGSRREIVLGGQRVPYALRRSRRRSIGFVVGAEGLAVSAPRWVAASEIEAALREKSAWILRKLHEQHERARRLDAARVEWRDGAELPYLGRPLTVVLDGRITGAVLEDDRRLRLGLPPTAAPGQIRDAVQSWLQRQARRVFEERCALFGGRLGVRMRRLSLSSAATRWGSASAGGTIRLNWRLIHFAPPVIDYVVTHELAHLREMNHGPAFWDVVRSALPDFDAARTTLRREVVPILD